MGFRRIDTTYSGVKILRVFGVRQQPRCSSRSHMCGMRWYILIALALVGLHAEGALILHNQTLTTGGPGSVVLDLYLPAAFGPFIFDDIALVPLLEIPRDCSNQSYPIPFNTGRFIAVWPRAGSCNSALAGFESSMMH
jgi:hypothetical protein